MASLPENIARVAAYYAAQAHEFDEISGFGKDFVEEVYGPLKVIYQTAFKGRRVLELACGTGYWTEALAKTAEFVLATDINPELVALAKQKLCSLQNVECRVSSAYSMEGVPETFTGAFAHFWWSHVPIKKQVEFLDTLHARLEPGALVLLADHIRYEAPTVRRRVDEHGDTYEERVLRDGRRFETIKNFPDQWSFADLLGDRAEDIQFTTHANNFIWTLFYRVR